MIGLRKNVYCVLLRSRPPDRSVCAGGQTAGGGGADGGPCVRDPVLVPSGGRQEDTWQDQVREID